MTAAIRSVFTASVALAGAGVIAVTPIAPTVDVHLPRLEAAAVQLAAATEPAFGALPYQILLNQLTDLTALAPILIGGNEQCSVCAGPAVTVDNPDAVPFTGWGGIGIATGLLGSPLVFLQTLFSTQNVGTALGAALAAIGVPLNNTLALLQADRTPDGGYDFSAVADRAGTALSDALRYAAQITAELIKAPLALLGAAVAGGLAFVGTLVSTSDFGAAVDAGLAPIQAAVTTNRTSLVTTVQTARNTLYADLTAGPEVATSPIPVVVATATASAPAPAAARAATAAVTAPRAAAVPNTGTAVSQVARDAVDQAAEAGTRIGTAVKAAVSGPKRVRAAAAR